MGKHSTFKVILDDVPQLTIGALTENGLLRNGTSTKGTLQWKCGKEIIATITIVSNMLNSPHISLSYTYNGQSRYYEVELEAVQSNLGKGIHWYFVCPVTKKRCRKLYGVKGLFLHREAFKNIACYRKQTESKPWREMRPRFERLYAEEDVYKELYSKYFKQKYRGLVTRRYLKLMRRIHG